VQSATDIRSFGGGQKWLSRGVKRPERDQPGDGTSIEARQLGRRTGELSRGSPTAVLHLKGTSTGEKKPAPTVLLDA